EGQADAFLIEDSLPLAVHDRREARIEVTTVAPEGHPGVVQLISLAARRIPLHVVPEWTGQPRLGRADYTQITEGGPLPHPPVAIITDHEILPLVWTRDAYYVCRTLLAVAPNEPAVRSAVEGFIAWLFEVAERPEGAWPRASLETGRAKDIAFQLDQQLYPPLLVVDYARLTGDPAQRERYGAACLETLDRLLARRSTFGLVPTAETPADDPLRQPYH